MSFPEQGPLPPHERDGHPVLKIFSILVGAAVVGATIYEVKKHTTKGKEQGDESKIILKRARRERKKQ